jgi:hypothetical protein
VSKPARITSGESAFKTAAAASTGIAARIDWRWIAATILLLAELVFQSAKETAFGLLAAGVVVIAARAALEPILKSTEEPFPF